MNPKLALSSLQWCGVDKMPMRDTLDKVVGTYFAAVCDEPFEYKGDYYEPKTLVVSPQLLRGFTCPAECGACCPRFSLDYLPFEKRPAEYAYLEPRDIIFNRDVFVVLSDLQLDHQDHHCRNLNKDDGRCMIHGRQPFSCDFELIRFAMSTKDDGVNRLNQRLYGRAWQMMRADGDRGTLCEMTPITKETMQDAVRRLERLLEWTTYFRLRTKLPRIIRWAQTMPTEPLYI